MKDQRALLPPVAPLESGTLTPALTPTHTPTMTPTGGSGAGTATPPPGTAQGSGLRTGGSSAAARKAFVRDSYFGLDDPHVQALLERLGVPPEALDGEQPYILLADRAAAAAAARAAAAAIEAASTDAPAGTSAQEAAQAQDGGAGGCVAL